MQRETKKILQSYIPIADMIVATFGSNCEVVIHDLNNIKSSLVYINGAVTGRKTGAPTTEVILQEIRQHGNHVKDIHGQTSQARDGKLLKTSTSFIRNEAGNVIGLIGINFDVTAFSLVNQIISEFSVANELNPIKQPTNESYARNVEEVFENVIENTLMDLQTPIKMMTKEDKLHAVKMIDEKGGFLIHGAVDRIARELRVTKQTIYNYLEELKNSSKDKEK